MNKLQWSDEDRKISLPPSLFLSVTLCPALSLSISVSLSVSLFSLICLNICCSHILTCTHTPPPTNSHVGIGCCFLSCVFFFMLCLYPSSVMQLLGQGLSWLLSSSLVASLYVILVCPFLPCCLLAGLKGKCFPVAGTAQIIPADYLTNATFSLFFSPSSPFSRLASCLRY